MGDRPPCPQASQNCDHPLPVGMTDEELAYCLLILALLFWFSFLF